MNEAIYALDPYAPTEDYYTAGSLWVPPSRVDILPGLSVPVGLAEPGVIVYGAGEREAIVAVFWLAQNAPKFIMRSNMARVEGEIAVAVQLATMGGF